MFVLAPTFTLETIAKVLLVSFGSFTGIPKVEVYAWFAVVLTFVNFIVYMTFYPAALSLILELMYSADGRARWDVRQIIQSLPSEDGYSPAVHKVNIFGNSIHFFISKRNKQVQENTCLCTLHSTSGRKFSKQQHKDNNNNARSTNLVLSTLRKCTSIKENIYLSFNTDLI